jgi:hypothetical protein
MKKFLVASVVMASMVVLAVSQSSAQSIASWDVGGTGSPFLTTKAAGTSDAFLNSIPVLSRGGGLLGNSGGSSFASTNWNNTANFDQNSAYITITVTPLAGYQLSLTDLKYSVNGSNTLPNQGMWGYSDGGGAFVDEAQFAIPFTGAGLVTWNFTPFTTVNSVEFRFWAWGTTSISGGTGSVGGSGRIFNTSGVDLEVDGTTSAVPEPSTLSLIGFGLVGMLAFARRRFSRS